MLRKVVVVLALLVLGLPLALGSSAGADTFTVTSTADSGPDTLRQAFLDANGTPGADTIVLGTGETYQLTTGPLVSDMGDLTIEGNGSTIEQTQADVVIDKTDTTLLTLNDVTITGGDGASAGGVASAGAVNLDGSSVVGNQSVGGGAGIFASGAVTAVGSTIAGNTGSGQAGGIWSGGDVDLTDSTVSGNSSLDAGGIWASGNVNVTNSTVSGNDGVALVGGISSGGTVTLVLATIVDNGQALRGNINATDLTSFGSVVALPALGGANCGVAGPVTQGYNFSDDATCGFTDATDRENAVDPRLTPLGFVPDDPVGDTQVHLPDSGSPLVDQIPVADARCAGTDQRGVARPQSAGCDIGAVEVRPILANPGSFSTPQGVELLIDLEPLVDDPDTQWPGGTTEIFWSSEIGTAVLEGDAALVRYTPAPTFSGTATIDYTACSDLEILCDSSVLTIQVTGQTQPLPVTPQVATPVSSTPGFTG